MKVREPLRFHSVDATRPRTEVSSAKVATMATFGLTQKLPLWQLFPMDMRSYLAREGLTQIELAQALGWSKSTINRLVSGARRPTLRQAVALERITRGAVTPRDFVSSDHKALSARIGAA